MASQDEQPPTQPAQDGASADTAPGAGAIASPRAAASAVIEAQSHPDLAASPVLLQHLHKAKGLSERLLAVMAQREERLAEIKRRVSVLEPAGESIQPLLEAENNMRDAHTRMKAVLADLGKELQTAGVPELPASSQPVQLPEPTGQGDEVAFLYKQLLLALGEWKAAQKRIAAERAESLARQVAELREQVSREHAETARIRKRKEELDRLRAQKQEELEAIKREGEDQPPPDQPQQ